MGHAARRLTAKDANEKLAHRRLTVVELAQRPGNVAEDCRRGGVARTSFDGWKRRVELEGLDGLKDLPPIAKSHPMTAPAEVVARIEELGWRTRPTAATGSRRPSRWRAAACRRPRSRSSSTTGASAPATSAGWRW